jgi:hypothetical protein
MATVGQRNAGCFAGISARQVDDPDRASVLLLSEAPRAAAATET